MTATDKACKAQSERSEWMAEQMDAITKQEHRLVVSAIGTAEWLEALAEIERLYAEMEG